LALNKLAVNEDIVTMKAAYISALEPSVWETPPATIFTEESDRINSALTSTPEEFQKYCPGKVTITRAARALGMDVNPYIDLVCSALKAHEGDALLELGKRLESALAPHLPSRV
jgi:hypothetical protein